MQYILTQIDNCIYIILFHIYPYVTAKIFYWISKVKEKLPSVPYVKSFTETFAFHILFAVIKWLKLLT